MKPTIALLVELPSETRRSLEANFTVLRIQKNDETSKKFTEVAPTVLGIVTSSAHGIDSASIDRFPHASIIGCFGVGYDLIDLAAAQAGGMRVTNTPGASSDDVADVALGLILDTSRRMSAAHRFVRAGHWVKAPFGFGQALSRKTLGILGLGSIGKAIARRAIACGMTVAYHGRKRQPEVAYTYVGTLLELARQSHFLVVALPGGDETHHLVDRKVLEALGPEGILINIGRGSIVDEAALLEALATGKLGGAGLDVFEHEPNVPIALLTDERVVVLPHIGSATEQSRNGMGRLLIDNLLAHFAGEPLPTPIL